MSDLENQDISLDAPMLDDVASEDAPFLADEESEVASEVAPKKAAKDKKKV